MAAVAMEDKKKEMIEKTAQEFQKLNGDNQMFILGYMLGIQQERQRTTPQPQTAYWKYTKSVCAQMILLCQSRKNHRRYKTAT